MSKTIVVELDYQPHPAQNLFHTSRATNRVLICGRQFGKTVAGSNEALRMAIEASSQKRGHDFLNVCVGAPTYWHLQRCWDGILAAIGTNYKVVVDDVHRAEHMMELKCTPPIRFWFRSAEDPNAFRSLRWDAAWIDECPIVPVAAWHALEPALMGRGIFTGSPKGHNWVYELWTRGQDPEQRVEWESWRFPTSANPYYPKDKIEVARKSLPDTVFRQEYLGEFIEDVGAVFRNVDSYVTEISQESVPGERYFVGADLAKTEDYQVHIALNDRGEICGYERFHELDWVLQRMRLLSFCHRYNDARLLIDSTGLGDPIFDELRRDYQRVDGYKFNTSTKADLVENLAVMLDDGKIHYPKIPVVLDELHLFGYELGRTGTMVYRASEGCHDDTVIALALAAWQLKKCPSGEIQVGFGKRPD